MTDIDEQLRSDAARWQREVDAGRRPDPVFTPGPAEQVVPARRRWLAGAAGVVGAAALVAGLFVGGVFDGTRASRVPGEQAGTGGAAPVSALRGVLWKDDSSGGTVVFDSHTVRIFDGCSNTTYTLSAIDRYLTIGAPVGLNSACGGAAQPGPNTPLSKAIRRREAAAARFAAVLAGNTDEVTWTVRDGVLSLTRDAKTVTLHRTGAAPEVVGTDWSLVRAADRDGELPDSAVRGSLRIDENGGVSAATPCRAVQGHATVTSTRIEFRDTEISSSGTNCRDADPTVTRVEAVVVDVLSSTTPWEIRGDQLILNTAEGSLLVYDDHH